MFRDYTAGMSHEQRLAQVRWLARLMDENFVVPGTSLRFGWDSVLGLFPGLGDVLTSAISLLIVHHAWQTGASKLTLARMLGNVGIDFVVGAIPFVGDLFDFAWKCESPQCAPAGAASPQAGSPPLRLMRNSCPVHGVLLATQHVSRLPSTLMGSKL